MEDAPPLRVDPASNSRVNTIPTSRVGVTSSTSVDPTAPAAIHMAPRIHQRNTRSNAPLPSMQTQQLTTSVPTPSPATNLRTPATDTPTLPFAPRRTTNNKNGRHQRRVKERNKITKIIQEQLEEDEEQIIHLLTPPSDNILFIYNTQNPKEGQPHHPNVTQDDWVEETVKAVPTTINKEEEENLHQLPWRSPIFLNQCMHQCASSRGLTSSPNRLHG